MKNNILQDETLSQKLINKWFWAYVFTVFTAPLWYFIRLLASNTLTVSDVGVFYSILSLFGLLACYNDLWLTESMQYFLPKYFKSLIDFEIASRYKNTALALSKPLSIWFLQRIQYVAKLFMGSPQYIQTLPVKKGKVFIQSSQTQYLLSLSSSFSQNKHLMSFRYSVLVKKFLISAFLVKCFRKKYKNRWKNSRGELLYNAYNNRCWCNWNNNNYQKQRNNRRR